MPECELTNDWVERSRDTIIMVDAEGRVFVAKAPDWLWEESEKDNGF